MQTSVDELLRLIGELYVENHLLREQLDRQQQPTAQPPPEPSDALP